MLASAGVAASPSPAITLHPAHAATPTPTLDPMVGLGDGDGGNTTAGGGFGGGSSGGVVVEGAVLPSVVMVLALLFIIVGTVIGNLLVCVAVCLVRKLRRPYNYLLVSLAVSDLCVALLVMPMALLKELLGQWQFGPLACDVWVSFDVLSCTASILNLCMISVDRYLAITRPLEYGVKRTPRRMVAYIAFVWLGAAFISLPPILILGNEHGESADDATCEVCPNFWYQIYATLGSFYIPLTVMFIVYYKIFCAAKRIVDEERKAQAHLRLVEEAEAKARGTYTQLRPVSSRYSVVEVNNGGVETRLAPEPPPPPPLPPQPPVIPPPPPPPPHPDETGSLLGSDSPHHLEVPTRHGVCSSSMSSAASGDSTTGSRWSLCETNGKAHPPTAARTPTQPAHNCYNACGSATNTNGEHGAASPRKRPHQQTKSRLKLTLAKERKASTTLGIIMSAFVVCWLPFFVLALVRPFDSSDPPLIPHWVSSLFLWLGYANSLLNPIIYATLNKDFRKPFQEILCLRCASLNILMREEFYHSQYGGSGHSTYSTVRNTQHTTIANSRSPSHPRGTQRRQYSGGGHGVQDLRAEGEEEGREVANS